MGFLDSIKDSIENFAKEAMKTREEKLREALKNIADPIASEISWEPLVSGGTNFKTNELFLNTSGNLEYKMSTKFFCT